MLHDTPARADSVPADITAPLILDFLEWLAKAPRPYGEVMEAWRTSCPRLTVWEDAVDGGYVERRAEGLGRVVVVLTDRGVARLRASGRGA